MFKSKITVLATLFTILASCCFTVSAEAPLLSTCELSGDILTVGGYGKDITLMLFEPGKTKDDLSNISSAEEYAATVNYTGVYNIGAYGNYSDTLKINNMAEDANYVLYVQSEDSQEKRVISSTLKMYVSLSGNDETGDGTEENPYKTLEKARNTLRSTTKSRPVEIIIRGGKYKIEKGFELTSADSGTEEAPITYKAADGEKVVFSGGTEIDISNVKNVTDGNILGRVTSETAKHLKEIDLEAAGFNKNYFDYDRAFMDPRRVEIYLNGKQQNVARWPNEGYATLKRVSDTSLKINELDSDSAKRIKNADKMYVEGYLGVNWYSEWISASCNASETFELKSTPAYGVTDGNRIAVVNLLEELDSPGEWYIDSDSMKMYWYPPYEPGSNDTLEIATLYNNFVTMTNVKNVNFEGIEFNLNVNNDADKTMQYAATYLTGNGITLVSCENVNINNCILKNIGTDGLFIYDSKNITADGCIIHNTGYNGVRLKKCLEEGTLNDCNVTIRNSIISKAVTDVGDNGNSGIQIESGVGITIENNIIHNMKNAAIRYTGNNHVIKNNEIYNCVNETSDAAAIYAGRSWVEYGTKISNNYFHTIGSEIDDSQASAVFWDDMHSGNTFENNVVDMGDKKYTSAVKIGGGRDNTVKDNVLVGGNYGVYGEDRTIYYTSLLGTPIYDQAIFKTFLNAAKGTVENAKEIGNDDWLDDYKTKFPEIMQNYENVMDKDYKRANTISGNTTYGNTGIKLATKMTSNSTSVNNTVASSNPISGYNFDGIGTENTVDDSMKAFDTVYPINNASVSNKNVTLVWSESEFADEYTVEIASDANFNTVKYSKTTQKPKAFFESIDCGEYYWRVTAVNKSFRMADTVLSGVRHFNAVQKTEICGVYNNNGSIEYTVVNNETGNKNITAIAALKTTDGKIVEIISDKKSVAPGTTDCTLSTAFTGSGDYTELFLWDMTNGQQPFSVKYKFDMQRNGD